MSSMFFVTRADPETGEERDKLYEVDELAAALADFLDATLTEESAQLRWSA